MVVITMDTGEVIKLELYPEIAPETVANFEKLVNEDSCNVTLFYGEGVTEEDTANLQARLEEKFPSVDVSIVFGGQPVYYYIISVE